MADFSGITNEDLQAELARRKNGDGWYFIVGRSDAEEDASLSFLLVPKKHWHLQHSVMDQHVARSVALPGGFTEVNESEFKFKGAPDEAQRLLERFGFARLDNPLWDSSTVYVPLLGVGWPRLDLKFDTAEIMELAERWIEAQLPERGDNLPSDWDRNVYCAKIRKFAEDHGLEMYVTSDYGERDNGWEGASISLISKDLARTIPGLTQAP